MRGQWSCPLIAPQVSWSSSEYPSKPLHLYTSYTLPAVYACVCALPAVCTCVYTLCTLCLCARYVLICTKTRLRMCTRTHACVCMHTHARTHAQRHRHRHTDTHTHTHTHTCARAEARKETSCLERKGFMVYGLWFMLWPLALSL
jgi:hypothetical protein